MKTLNYHVVDYVTRLFIVRMFYAVALSGCDIIDDIVYEERLLHNKQLMC